MALFFLKPALPDIQLLRQKKKQNNKQKTSNLVSPFSPVLYAKSIKQIMLI